MVKEAILALKERTGSSLPAITKFIAQKHPNLPANWKRTLSVQLKNLTKAGKLVKVKASFKLSDALKAPPKPKKVVKKVVAAKKPKSVKTVKKAAPKPKTIKKTTTTKKTATKAAPKAKKPAAKKAPAAKKTPTKKPATKKPAAKKPAAKKPKTTKTAAKK